jgi:MFS transporter, FSR family, fosmidomycin resistance protein
VTQPRKRALATCCAAHTLHDGLSDIIYVLLPVLAQAFGLSLSQVGLIRSAHRAALAAFQIPAGLIAEKFGARNLLTLGTFIAGCAFIALGYVEGFWPILIVLFFAGMGSAVQHPLCSTIISHAYPGEGRRAALGTYNFFGDVGKFAFGGTMSLLLVAGLAWQVPIVGYGIVGAVIAVLIFLWVADARIATPAPRAAAHTAAKTMGWGIRSREGFAALCAIEVLDSSTRTGFLTFIAFLLMAKGLSEGWAVLAVPMILVGGMAGKLACGFLAERVGIIRTIVITEAATATGILLCVALPATWAFVLLPLVGIVLQGTSSVLYATIGDLVEPDRLPRTFGLFYTVGSICGIAAPLVYGMIGDLAGVETAITTVGCVVLLTLPLSIALRSAIGAARPAAI